MSIKPPEFEVPAKNPFENDVLNRKELVPPLIDLLSNIKEPFALGITSPFGTGKTTFLKMWKQELENDGFGTAIINIWENDFIDDPLACLLGAMQEATTALKEKNTPIHESLKKINRLGGAIIKRALPLAVKVVTINTLDLEKEHEAILAKLGEDLSSDLIQSFLDNKKTIKDFKEALGGFISEYNKKFNATDDKPFVIIIDDLDRCRPGYAIELLERMKHLFDIKQVVFILAYDKAQLKSIINTSFGHEFDADNYMRKFVDLEFNLPKPSTEQFVNYQFKRFSLDAPFSERTIGDNRFDGDNIKELFTSLFRIFETPLRAQEHCFTQLSIAVKTTPKNHILLPFLLASMIALKSKNSDLYYRFVDKKSNYEDVINYIKGFSGGEIFINEHSGTVLEAYLAMCNSTEEERINIKDYYSGIVDGDNNNTPESSTVDNSDDGKHRAAKIRGIMRSITNYRTIFKLEYVIKKIELLDRFHIPEPSPGD